MSDKNRFASRTLVEGGVKKISNVLEFDNTGRTTINYPQGQIVGITLKDVTYTYALRFLNESQTLVYLIDAYTNNRSFKNNKCGYIFYYTNIIIKNPSQSIREGR